MGWVYLVPSLRRQRRKYCFNHSSFIFMYKATNYFSQSLPTISFQRFHSLVFFVLMLVDELKRRLAFPGTQVEIWHYPLACKLFDQAKVQEGDQYYLQRFHLQNVASKFLINGFKSSLEVCFLYRRSAYVIISNVFVSYTTHVIFFPKPLNLEWLTFFV